MELPYFQEYYSKYQDQGLEVVAINILIEQDHLLPEWKDKHGIEFPILVGPDLDHLAETYRLESTPLNFLLDSEGKIVKRFDQYYPGAEKEVEEAIRELLGIG
jgi:peroxiredoxin